MKLGTIQTNKLPSAVRVYDGECVHRDGILKPERDRKDQGRRKMNRRRVREPEQVSNVASKERKRT